MLVLFIGGGTIAYQVELPGQILSEVVEREAGTRTVTYAKTLENQLMEHYIPQAVALTAYQKSRDLGLNLEKREKKWLYKNIVSREMLKEELSRISEKHMKGYMESSRIPAGCRIDMEAPRWEVWRGSTFYNTTGPKGSVIRPWPGIIFNLQTPGNSPSVIKCGKSSRWSKTTASVEENPFSWGNRFFYEYEVAKDVAKNETFHEVLAKTVTDSSEYLVAETNEKKVGSCTSAAKDGDSCHWDNNPATGQLSYPKYSQVKDDAENEQESAVVGSLSGALADFAESYNATEELGGPGYKNLTVEFDVKEVEYEITDKEKVSEDDVKGSGWTVTNCGGPTCDDCDTNSCTGCECTVSEPDPCPDQLCGEDPFKSYWAGDTWTHDPWKLVGDESHADPFTLDMERPYPVFGNAQQTQTSSTLRPLDLIKAADCGDDCDWCSDNSTNCETVYNDVYQKLRRVWEFKELKSRVLVVVKVKDEKYVDHQTKAGLNPVNFYVKYTQKQTFRFEDDQDGEASLDP